MVIVLGAATAALESSSYTHKEVIMNIAILKGGEVIDAAVFDDIEIAQEFLDASVWEDADAVAELPEGYGIGDSYADDEWEKAPQPEPPEPWEPPLDPFTLLIYRVTMLEIAAGRTDYAEELLEGDMLPQDKKTALAEQLINSGMLSPERQAELESYVEKVKEAQAAKG